MPSGPNNWGTSADNASIGSVGWSATGSPGTPDFGGSFSSGAITHYINLTNFGFSGLSQSPIGIFATLMTSVSGPLVVDDHSVMLIKGGVLVGTDKSAGAAWNHANSYGGSGDLWGTTWLDSDITSSTFGIALSGITVGSNSGSVTLTGATITVYTSGDADLNGGGAGSTAFLYGSRRTTFLDRDGEPLFETYRPHARRSSKVQNPKSKVIAYTRTLDFRSRTLDSFRKAA